LRQLLKGKKAGEEDLRLNIEMFSREKEFSKACYQNQGPSKRNPFGPRKKRGGGKENGSARTTKHRIAKEGSGCEQE